MTVVKPESQIWLFLRYGLVRCGSGHVKLFLLQFTSMVANQFNEPGGQRGPPGRTNIDTGISCQSFGGLRKPAITKSSEIRP